jgi:hypothetical protein
MNPPSVLKEKPTRKKKINKHFSNMPTLIMCDWTAATACCNQCFEISIKSYIYEYAHIFLQWWQPEKDFCPEEFRSLHPTVIEYIEVEKLQWYEELDSVEDHTYNKESKNKMEKICKEEFDPAYLLMLYDDLLATTNHALLLHLLKTAFSNPKCREEAFNFLKQPKCTLVISKTTIKQDESAAGTNKSNNSFPKPP